MICKDGTRLPVMGSTRQMPDGRYQYIFQDVSKRKQAEEQVRALNEQLDKRVRDRTAELEAANRVLDQRSRSLISLQTVSQTLIGTDDLERLAAQVCRQAQELCGSDRAVLYFLRPHDRVEVLATQGWDPERFAIDLRREGVFTMDSGGEPAPYHRWPLGIPPRHPDVEGAELRAGLYAPLIAQHEVVGLMVGYVVRLG